MGKRLLQLLLNGLIFIKATAYFYSSFYKNDLPSGYRLPDYVIPEHYNIKLEPFFEIEGKSFNFWGRCEVFIKIISPTWYISLHAQKPQIKIQNATVIDTESSYKPTNITYNNETHILIFHFDYKLSNGQYLLKISFIGLSDNDGNFFRTYYTDYDGYKFWFVATHVRAIGARQLFPCWDEPAFKATFNITVKHHFLYTVWSSMPIENINYDEDKTWTHFKTTRLMSTYLVTLALHHFYLLTPFYDDIEHESLLIQNTAFAKNFTYNVIMDYRNKWKYSENLSNVNYFITSKGPQHNGMGLILYKASNVLYNETLDPVSQKMKTSYLVAYEVARQWFNNLISPSWWSDYWLHEGIAKLIGMDIIDKIFQDYSRSRMLDLYAVQSKRESLYLDDYKSGIMNPLISKIVKPSEIDSVFSFSYYIKAPVILRMLQQLLSDEVFQQGIEIFLNEHKFSSATINDFWSAMQAAQNVTKIPNDKLINVKEMMDAWTKEKHYPVLKITPSDFNSKLLIISIENFNNLAKVNWFMPINITVISMKQSYIKTFIWQLYWKSQQNILYTNYIDIPTYHVNIGIFFEQCNLIMVNSQLGYYRVNYETEHWQIIAKYLNTAGYNKLNVINRAQIIDDAFYFFSNNELDVITFYSLIQYLSKETDYVAWYPMIKALEHMSRFFPISDEDILILKGIIKDILNKVLYRIGYEERSEEDYFIKFLRQEVAKWACILKIHNCLQIAKNKLERHLIHHEKLLPWWKKWTYCNGIMLEENLTGIWKTVLEKWISNSDKRIFEFLTCIAHPNSIKEYLDKKNFAAAVSFKNISLQLQELDQVNKFLSIISKYANNNETLEYILNNFRDLKPRNVGTVAALIIIINNVYSGAQLDKIEQFVANNLKKCIDIIATLKENVFFQKEFDKEYGHLRNLINQRILFTQYKIIIRTNQIVLLQNQGKKLFK